MSKAARLATYGQKLDLNKGLSYGVNNSANNLIDERAKADKLVWEIANTTDKDVYIVISSLFTGATNLTTFANIAEMQAAVVPGADAAIVLPFANGRIAGDAVAGVTVSSKTPGRSINQLLRYIGRNSSRITKMRLKSVTTANAADLGNFDNEIKSMFFSPFSTPVENQLGLSRLVKTNNNFSPNILDVDFVAEAFPFILSSEHFNIMQVNAGTKLNITVEIGAQDSAPQRFWRTIKNADDILRSEGI